ncbi:PREDICTED: uncharacterized protein LOC109215290 [Nicotiana attenuata]|uniref:uncharacterized protein LOC109215290 n=1 Tax=Nicotiana attenuata TaxID=49451 RepID=UPI0009056A0F|nr:PREDICTED: uncharacterized protein LOC109215290 [Nicotiana attenuata]
MATIRKVIAVASSNDWPFFHMDVNNVFLQGDLEEEVYMEMPQGFQQQGEYRASRQWNIKLTTALVQAGHIQSPYDHSFFTKKRGAGIVVILMYVDDLLITGSNVDLIHEAKDSLHGNFKMKDLGELRYFLGIEVMRSKEGIVLNQRKYALELISKVGLSGCKPASTPMELNHKLTTVDYDMHMGITEDAKLGDITTYQKLIGKLLYWTITRPDLCFVVQVLSQFMQRTKQSHLNVAMRIIRYIKGSPDLGIFLKKGETHTLTAYCDSDWAAFPNTRRSITSYVVK